MDEVAFPIVLAWQLGRTGPDDWEHVRLSADFLVANGPAHRPGALGEHRRLLAGHDRRGDRRPGLRGRHRPQERRSRPCRRATSRPPTSGSADLEKWTLTRNGPLSREPYYLRITDNGDANSGRQDPDRRRRPADRPAHASSTRASWRWSASASSRPTTRTSPRPCRVIDRELMYDTANGPFWHRASFDGYGETARRQPVGAGPDPGSGETLGRGWPLLTGERGEYALAAGQPRAAVPGHDGAVADDSGSHVIAEQVWDHRAAGRHRPAFVPGENTFSATPLAWSHAQFIRLARSIDAGRPVETPQVVACRYNTTLCPP